MFRLAAALLVLSQLALALSQSLLLADRHAGTSFFAARESRLADSVHRSLTGDPELYTRLVSAARDAFEWSILIVAFAASAALLDGRHGKRASSRRLLAVSTIAAVLVVALDFALPSAEDPGFLGHLAGFVLFASAVAPLAALAWRSIDASSVRIPSADSRSVYAAGALIFAGVAVAARLLLRLPHPAATLGGSFAEVGVLHVLHGGAGGMVFCAAIADAFPRISGRVWPDGIARVHGWASLVLGLAFVALLVHGGSSGVVRYAFGGGVSPRLEILGTGIAMALGAVQLSIIAAALWSAIGGDRVDDQRPPSA